MRNPDYHNTRGPLKVGKFPYYDKNAGLLIKAFRDAGHPERDVNAAEQIGVMKVHLTQKDGLRMSTNRAYIRPIRDFRRNLVIKTESRVLRVIIDHHTESAIGIEFMSKDNSIHTVYATKEVILSAGAIDSPRILKLSGIGPKFELESLGIPVIKNLPVGYNLLDHVTNAGVFLRVSKKTSTMKNFAGMLEDIEEYLNYRKGPLSGKGISTLSVFMKTNFSSSPVAPDVQYNFGRIDVNAFIENPRNYSGQFPQAYYDGITVSTILLRPRSKGYILLNKTDPIFGEPLIYANYFTEYPDKETLVEGIKHVVKVLKTADLNKNGIVLDQTAISPCDRHMWGTDDYWSCMVQEYTATSYHPVGTCKMGPPLDSEAVVDARLRVYGVKNLRVIDAAIMPTIIRGNTNAPVIMIAEKASDMIKEDWANVYY